MRKGVILVCLLLIAGLGIAGYLLKDTLTKLAIQKTYLSLTGAPIDIEKATLHLAPLRLTLDNVGIANKDNLSQYLVEIDRIHWALPLSPLLRKKLIIDDVTVTNIKKGGGRKVTSSTNGKAPLTTPKSAQNNASPATAPNIQSARNEKDLPSLDIGKLSKRLKLADLSGYNDLTLPKKGPQLRAKVNGDIANLKNAASLNNLSTDIDNLSKQWAALKSQSFNSPKAALAGLTQIKALGKGLSQSKTNLNQQSNQINTGFATIYRQIREIDTLRAKDLETVRRSLSLDQLTVGRVSSVLFGDKITDIASKTLHTIKRLQSYLPKKKPPKEKRKRLKGKNIVFKGKNPSPSVWIKRINISGEGQKTSSLSGRINHLSSHPTLLKEPCTVFLNARKWVSPTSKSSLRMTIRDEVHGIATVSGLRAPATTLYNRNRASIRLTSGQLTTSTQFKLWDNQLDAESKWTGTRLKFQTPSPSGLSPISVISRLLRQSSELDATIRLGGSRSRPKLSVSSNLETLFAKAAENEFKQERKKMEAKLRNDVEQIANEEKQRLTQRTRTEQQALEKKLSKHRQKLTKIQAEIDQKKAKLQQQINKESKKVEDELDTIKTKFKSLF